MWGDRPFIEWTPKTLMEDFNREDLPGTIDGFLRKEHMEITENRTLQKIGGLDVGVPDDLFIATVSFETRCCSSIQRLSEGYQVNRALLLRFKKPNQGSREEHFREMSTQLVWRTVGQRLPDVLWCEKDDGLDGYFKLVRYLEALPQPPQRITLDITTVTKQYLLLLLRTIRTKLPNAGLQFFTPLRVYSFPQGHTRMSHGVKYVTPVPFYAGIQYPERSDLLVLFLGYEGERAVRLWRTVEPERTIAIIANPAFRPGGHLPTIRNNRTLLELDRSVLEQRQVPAGSPGAVFWLLSQIKEEFRDWNVMVSCLGPKVQVIGAFLFFEQHESLPWQMLYAPAATYDEKHYSVSPEPFTMEYRLPAPGDLSHIKSLQEENMQPVEVEDQDEFGGIDNQDV